MPDKLIKGETDCWCCGQPVEAWVYEEAGRVSNYHCDNCHVWFNGSARPHAMFTDPAEMKRFGYIDHGSVHVPSPA